MISISNGAEEPLGAYVGASAVAERLYGDRRAVEAVRARFRAGVLPGVKRAGAWCARVDDIERYAKAAATPAAPTARTGRAALGTYTAEEARADILGRITAAGADGRTLQWLQRHFPAGVMKHIKQLVRSDAIHWVNAVDAKGKKVIALAASPDHNI
jgi:hypothetical protein